MTPKRRQWTLLAVVGTTLLSGCVADEMPPDEMVAPQGEDFRPTEWTESRQGYFLSVNAYLENLGAPSTYLDSDRPFFSVNGSFSGLDLTIQWDDPLNRDGRLRLTTFNLEVLEPQVVGTSPLRLAFNASDLPSRVDWFDLNFESAIADPASAGVTLATWNATIKYRHP